MLASTLTNLYIQFPVLVNKKILKKIYNKIPSTQDNVQQIPCFWAELETFGTPLEPFCTHRTHPDLVLSSLLAGSGISLSAMSPAL